jgi:large subunit ribosomal protein L33
MAKKGGAGRVTIHLECSTCRASGIAGVSRYSLKKNKKRHTTRLELMKYCRFERKHTLHKEVR